MDRTVRLVLHRPVSVADNVEHVVGLLGLIALVKIALRADAQHRDKEKQQHDPKRGSFAAAFDGIFDKFVQGAIPRVRLAPILFGVARV